MKLADLSSVKYRWLALVFLSLGLAIVIIDNTVLNVAIPYILRDLNTTFDAMQWVVSGYALIIATLLITVGRLGDLFGRKKIFLLGTVFFAIGSFIASISLNVYILFFGEAFIEAIGAAMMLTSSLSLLASEFQGRERAIAFGIWGSVAGASAAVGPLLGGYLTTYASWRWSLRINVLVAIIAILGSVFIKESKVAKEGRFDWLGTFFSGIGFFSLIFAIIEGRNYGWWNPAKPFSIGTWSWPFSTISVIPFAFAIAAVFISAFIITEFIEERKKQAPLLKPSLFKNIGFTLGLLTVGIISLGQIGTFFILPIYLQKVLGLTAFQTGLVFLPSSIASFIVGSITGFVASRISPKWVVTFGMLMFALGDFLLMNSLSISATPLSLTPAFMVFGLGIGMASAQLTNVVLSSAPLQLAGEASAANATMRQIGSSIGTAIIGTILATSLTMRLDTYIKQDTHISPVIKQPIIAQLKNINIESQGQSYSVSGINRFPAIASSVKNDVNQSIVDASKEAFKNALFFMLAGTILSAFIPSTKKGSEKE